jgi:hypothetical protein
MTRRLTGAVASSLVLLTGLWLILAPFALGIQPEDVAWKDETLTDVWSGIGLGALGLIGVITFAAALVQCLREGGLIARQNARSPADSGARASTPESAPPPAPSSDLDRLLAPLIEALTSDLARDRETASVNSDSAQRSAGTADRSQVAQESRRSDGSDRSKEAPR